MAVIQNRLAELVAIKARKEGRKITNADIARELGMGVNSVGDWMNNRIKRYDRDTMARICAWVPCQVSELLVLESDNEVNKKAHQGFPGGTSFVPAA